MLIIIVIEFYYQLFPFYLSTLLARANITSVMKNKIKSAVPELPLNNTREKLIKAGTDAFYKNGYLGSSLRQICSACGVTTGAFYFFFSNKEELLCSIVDPVFNQLKTLSDALTTRELGDASTGIENDHTLMEFELAHRKELLILLENAHGSCRENAREEFCDILRGYFRTYLAAELGREPIPEAVELLFQIRYEINLYILKGASDMKQALFLNDLAACYADGGYHSLMKTYKDQL